MALHPHPAPASPPPPHPPPPPPFLHLCCTSSGGDTSLVLLDGPFYIALIVDHRLTTPATLPLRYDYEKNEMYHAHMALRFPAPTMLTPFLYLNIKTLYPNIKRLLKSSGSGPPCNPQLLREFCVFCAAVQCRVHKMPPMDPVLCHINLSCPGVRDKALATLWLPKWSLLFRFMICKSHAYVALFIIAQSVQWSLKVKVKVKVTP